MKKPKRSALNWSLLLVTGSVAGMFALPLLIAIGVVGLDFRQIGLGMVLVLVFGATAGVGLSILHQEMNSHFDDLERLRGDVVMVGEAASQLPRHWSVETRADDELKRLAGTINDMLGRQQGQRAVPDARLEAVVGTIADGLIVVTDTGLVSLINSAAAALFGQIRAAVGTSVYAALEREDVIAAAQRARTANRPVSAMIRTVEGDYMATRVVDLGHHGGFALTFQAAPVDHRPGVVHDFGLHDVLPPAGKIADSTELLELPTLVLDTETTGLNVRTDRIVSIGAVRVHGNRVFHNVTLDRLVNPGLAIPARSTAVHGITNSMVAGAPPFADVVGELQSMMSDTVIVGHNIRFDLAMLRRESERAGIAWKAPLSLDTGLLVIALEPNTESLNLEAVANRFGVEIQGRHTALGDCLVTAEVFVRMIPRLHDLGIRTFAEAIAFQKRAKHMIGMQEQEGW
jgi:DNA polymerase-3 subunit epsilon